MTIGFFQTTGFYAETPETTHDEIEAVTRLVTQQVPTDEITVTLMMLGLLPSPERPPETIKKRKVARAIRKPKTHCARGHALTPDNIYGGPHVRRCKTCVLEYANKRKTERKEGAV